MLNACSRPLLVLGALFFALTLRPSSAHACGGTFCDRPPQGQPPMPVDQSGENVLFVMQDGMVEAHIQIQYTGDPEKFAWVVPVPEIPELSVGSQLLFLNVLNGTVPTFQSTATVEVCSSDGQRRSSSSVGCGMAGSDSSESYSPASNPGSTQGSKNEQALTRSVGAFDVAILQPSSVSELDTWLLDNGFEPDEEAPPIFQEYLSRGYAFVAIKLHPGAGINEIHPLVVRYPGNEPCVPLKLTRIAATEDMVVRTFFLGNERVYPTSYKHVVLNESRLDWLQLGANYMEVVSRAVDSPTANGRAFVTEYAGTSSVVATTGIHSSSWNSAAFGPLAPPEVVPTLQEQGLIQCSSAQSCSSTHPLVFPLLDRYLPPPAGVAPADFYACITCFEGQADFSLWDGPSFASEVESLIVAPGRHALEILAVPYLTRMITTISPSEMTEDPMFAELGGETMDSERSVTLRRTCEGNQVAELPDGRQLALPSRLSWPDVDARMPWAERVEDYATGELIVLMDGTPTIDQQIHAWNAAEQRDDTSSQRQASGCSCRAVGNRVPPSPALGVALFAIFGVLRRATRRKLPNTGQR